LIVAPANWKKATNTFAGLNTSQYSHLMAREADLSGEVDFEKNVKTSAGTNGRTEALAASPSARFGVVLKFVQERFGSLLGVVAEDVAPSKKIPELGVDSLMAIEIKVCGEC
jgi:Phosphopantetheine attachment site